MKKALLLFVAIVLLISCDKKKPIPGVRKEIFLNNTSIQVDGDKSKIKISESDTFENYYGDGSILNQYIENYRVNNLNFDEFYIARKKFGVKNYFFSNPVIVDNIIYYLDTNGNLIAKNNISNEELWKIKIIGRNNFMNYYGGKISYYNKTIFITTRLNEVIAVSNDGTLKWKKKLNTIPISAPVIDEDVVYVITNDNKLYALDVEDGKIKWISYGNPKESAILGSANPVIYNDYVVASYSSGELFVLNKATGEVVFSMNLIGRYLIFSNFELTDIDSTPVIKNGIMVATANNGITTGIDLNTMKVLWKQNLPSLTNILINDEFVYLITTDNSVVCLNLKDGKVNWFKDLDRYEDMVKKKGVIFYKSLLFINNQLYAFNNIGQYKAINLFDGEIKEEVSLPFIFYSIPFSLNDNLNGIGFNGGRINLIKSK